MEISQTKAQSCNPLLFLDFANLAKCWSWFQFQCTHIWQILVCKPFRIWPNSFNKSWSWYVDLQLLLIEFLLTRRGLGVTEAQSMDFSCIFGVELEVLNLIVQDPDALNWNRCSFMYLSLEHCISQTRPNQLNFIWAILEYSGSSTERYNWFNKSSIG